MTRILIVDGDPGARAVYREILSFEGYKVAEAAEWEECLDLFVKHKDFNLILLDIETSGADAAVVCDAARLLNPQMRVLVSSASALDEIARLAIRADDYFEKSSGSDILIQKVRRLLESGAPAVV